MTTDAFEHIDPEDIIIQEDSPADELNNIIEVNCRVRGDVTDKYVSYCPNIAIAKKLKFTRFFDRRPILDFETFHDYVLRFDRRRITTLDAVRILAAIRSEEKVNGFYIDIHPEIKFDNAYGIVCGVTLTHDFNEDTTISGHQAAALARAVELLERKPTSFAFRFHLILQHFDFFIKGITEICHIALKENYSLMYPIAGREQSVRQSAYSEQIRGYQITKDFAKNIGVIISCAASSDPYGDRENIMSLPAATFVGRQIKELFILTNYEEYYFRYVYYLGDYYDATDDKTYYVIAYDFQPSKKDIHSYEMFDAFLDLKTTLENDRCV